MKKARCHCPVCLILSFLIGSNVFPVLIPSCSQAQGPLSKHFLCLGAQEPDDLQWTRGRHAGGVGVCPARQGGWPQLVRRGQPSRCCPVASPHSEDSSPVEVPVAPASEKEAGARAPGSVLPARLVRQVMLTCICGGVRGPSSSQTASAPCPGGSTLSGPWEKSVLMLSELLVE